MNPHLLLRQTFLYDPHFILIFTCGSTNVMWGHLRPVASFPFLWNWNEDKNQGCSNNLKKKIGTRTKQNLSRAKNICVSATNDADWDKRYKDPYQNEKKKVILTCQLLWAKRLLVLTPVNYNELAVHKVFGFCTMCTCWEGGDWHLCRMLFITLWTADYERKGRALTMAMKNTLKTSHPPGQMTWQGKHTAALHVRPDQC